MNVCMYVCINTYTHIHVFAVFVSLISNYSLDHLVFTDMCTDVCKGTHRSKRLSAPGQWRRARQRISNSGGIPASSLGSEKQSKITPSGRDEYPVLGDLSYLTEVAWGLRRPKLYKPSIHADVCMVCWSCRSAGVKGSGEAWFWCSAPCQNRVSARFHPSYAICGPGDNWAVLNIRISSRYLFS